MCDVYCVWNLPYCPRFSRISLLHDCYCFGGANYIFSHRDTKGSTTRRSLWRTDPRVRSGVGDFYYEDRKASMGDGFLQLIQDVHQATIS